MTDEIETLKLLKSFISLAKTGSYRKSGKDIELSYTTITRNIKKLEKLLECSLFKVENEKFTLTENGEKLQTLVLPRLEALNLNIIKAGLEEFEASKIFVYPHCIKLSIMIDSIIKSRTKKGEKIKTFLKFWDKNTILKKIENNKLDIAFLPLKDLEIKNYSKFNLAKITPYKIAVCTGTRHPIAKLPPKEITFDELAKYNILEIYDDFIVKELIEPFNHTTNDLENDNSKLTERLTATSLNLSFFEYQSIKYFNHSNLNIVNISRLFPKVSIYAITRKNDDNIHRLISFINLVKRKLK